MAEDKQPAIIKLQRKSLTINSSGRPAVFYAREIVSWKDGRVPICGLVESRNGALIAVDIEFENLKNILDVH